MFMKWNPEFQCQAPSKLDARFFGPLKLEFCESPEFSLCGLCAYIRIRVRGHDYYILLHAKWIKIMEPNHYCRDQDREHDHKHEHDHDHESMINHIGHPYSKLGSILAISVDHASVQDVHHVTTECECNSHLLKDWMIQVKESMIKLVFKKRLTETQLQKFISCIYLILRGWAIWWQYLSQQDCSWVRLGCKILSRIFE